MITWMDKTKRAIFDLILKNVTFPSKCKSDNELDWMLKGNCPCCIKQPIESLSNKEYHEKYPANNRIQIGTVTIFLCDVHLKELKSELLEYEHI